MRARPGGYIKRGILSFAGLIALGGLLELSSFAADRLVKWNTPPASLAMPPRERAIDRRAHELPRDYVELLVIHPYLGYVYNPEENRDSFTAFHRLPISDSGFVDDKSPVQVSSPDRLIVGVFGGSFAQGFSVSSGLEALWDELKEVPEYAHRQLMVVRVGLGGYKQPQQLMALNYLLALGAHFDLVINLDGFNEVALPPSENLPKGVFPFYPRAWFSLTDEMSDPGFTERVAHKRHLQRQRQAGVQWLTQTPLRHSVTATLFWRWRDQRFAQAIAKEDVALLRYPISGARYVTRGPSRSYATPDDLYKDLVAMWKNSALLMQQLCEANGIRYVHFLQPNQYVPGSKRMGAEERRVAYQDLPYRELVERGYPYLKSAGEGLVEKGVSFHDLTMIFQDHEEPLYSDTCCHVNEAGYQILGRTMGQMVRSFVQETPARSVATPSSEN